jgi:hypothetical protein
MPMRPGLVQESGRPSVSSGAIARRLIPYFKPHKARLTVSLLAMAGTADAARVMEMERRAREAQANHGL